MFFSDTLNTYLKVTILKIKHTQILHTIDQNAVISLYRFQTESEPTLHDKFFSDSEQRKCLRNKLNLLCV